MIFLPIFNEAKGFCRGSVVAPDAACVENKSHFWMKCSGQPSHDVAGGAEGGKETFFFSWVRLTPFRRGAWGNASGSWPNRLVNSYKLGRRVVLALFMYMKICIVAWEDERTRLRQLGNLAFPVRSSWMGYSVYTRYKIFCRENSWLDSCTLLIGKGAFCGQKG